MLNGIAILSIIPMRSEASGKSEMVSQLLFGETYRILEEKNEWLLIHTDFDDYRGWINKNQFYPLNQPKKEVFSLCSFPFLAILDAMENRHFIPCGSFIYNVVSENQHIVSF